MGGIPLAGVAIGVLLVACAAQGAAPQPTTADAPATTSSPAATNRALVAAEPSSTPRSAAPSPTPPSTAPATPPTNTPQSTAASARSSQPIVAPTPAPQPTVAPTAATAPTGAPTQAPQPTIAPSAAPAPTGAPTLPPPAGALSIRVSGNHFVDGGGRTIRLVGVNRDGTEYMCLRRGSVFDGPSDDRSIAAMVSWGINAVRIPLNEDCWLNINTAQIAGATYQNAIRDYVTRLHRAGVYTILDLHWNGPGTTIAANQQAFADADHATQFWTEVAQVFGTDQATIFDLYNEPFIDAALGPAQPATWWQCWLNGCNVNVLMVPPGQTRTTATWRTTGMQQLVSAVRGAGATVPLMVGGLQWSNDLRGILDYLPRDPLGQLAISWHEYDWNPCRTATCRNDSVIAAARVLPLVTGEFGEQDCASGFNTDFMQWADQVGISYLAWAWVMYGPDCRSGFSLISNFDGTPSPYGLAIRDHIRSLALR